MCNPALFIMAGSAIMQGVSSYQQSAAAKAAGEYNAKVNELRAVDAESRGVQEGIRHRQQVAQLKGSQRASLAANGLDLGEGSALDILTGTDILGTMDAGGIRQNAEREAAGYRSAATMDAFGASQQKPLLAGATSLLSGAGGVASKWYDMKSVGAGY